VSQKADIGACAKLHSEPLKAQYEKRIQQSPRDYGFEVEAEGVIERLVLSCDRKIEGAKRRLQSEQEYVRVRACVRVHVSVW
jgi:hypothetical protein